MLDGNFSYYQAMIDKDFEERQSSEREIKDEAVNILGQTGYENPVSALDENPDYSPFEEEIKRTAPNVRQVERGEKGAQPAWEANPLLQTPNEGRFPQSVTTPKEDPNFPSGSTYQNSFEEGLDKILNPPNPEYPMTTTGLVPTQPIPAAPFTPMNQQAQQSASMRMSIPAKAGSTAPQIITEKEVADNTRDTKQFLMDNIKGAELFKDFSKNAKIATAEGQAEAADIQTQLSQSDFTRIAQQNQREAENLKNAQVEADAVTARLATEVDPNRIWNNKSTWSKIALVLGAAFQGAAGSDAGLKLIESIMQKDIDAQIDDRAKGVARKGQLVDYIGLTAKNQTELQKQMREASMKIVDGYQKAISAGKKKEVAEYEAFMEMNKEYLNPLIKQVTAADKNLMSASGQEQKRQDDDVKNAMKAEELKASAMDRQLKKSELQKLPVEEQKVGVAIANMAQSAGYMASLENRKDFDPTKIIYAIKQVVADKGIPPGLTKDESKYMASYARYFTFIRQQVTGAAASVEEEARISKFVVAMQTNPKNALRDFQVGRDEIIRNMATMLNPEAKMRLSQIPETRKYLIDRSQLVPRK